MSTAVVEQGPAPVATPQDAPAELAAQGSVSRFFSNTWAITKKELSIYFTTPLSYAVFTVFLVILSIFFNVYLKGYVALYQRQMMMQQFGQGNPDGMNFTDHIFSPILQTSAVVMLFLAPFLTIRLIAEEKRQQTFQLLMTTPVRTWEIVLGKFIAAQVVIAAAFSLTIIYPLMLNSFASDGKVELATAVTAYVGLFLFVSSLLSIGIFCSSLSESQIVAGLVTFGIELILWVLPGVAQNAVSDPVVKETFNYVSILTHLQKFLVGKVALADICYFVSLIFLGLFLTRASIERSRW